MRSVDRPDPDLTRPIMPPAPAPQPRPAAHEHTWAPATTPGYLRCATCGAVKPVGM